MIGVFFIFLVASGVVSSIFTKFMGVSTTDGTAGLIMSMFPTIIMMVIMGFMGDKLYKRRADKCYMDGDRERVMRKYGGTKMRNVIIYILLVVLLVVGIAVMFLGALSALPV